MLELKDGFVLYLGSYCEVKAPDLGKCAKRKDFGQGFYLTTSKEQAESFLRTSIVKAIATGTIEREMAKYDIIAGKIADDATNATLTAYLAGAFGTEGDQEAAIECLKFVKGEKIWLK